MKNAKILSIHVGLTETSSLSPPQIRDANLAAVQECLDLAGAYAPDFICFPEIIPQSGCPPQDHQTIALEPSAPAIAAISARAKELNSYIIFPSLERIGDTVYNSAFLFDNHGNLSGTYRKFHATGYEIQRGITPGIDTPVWQTPFGTVGIAICFDLKFPDLGIAYARQNVQCIFWPTMFAGGNRLESWAMDYGTYMVSCQCCGGQITAPDGTIPARNGLRHSLQTGNGTCSFTVAELNLDHRSYHYDFHQKKLLDIEKKYGQDITIRSMVPEAIFNLTCNLPDRTIDDIEKEFDLQPLRHYLDQATEIREQKLELTGKRPGALN